MDLIQETKIRYEIALTYFGFIAQSNGVVNPYGDNYAGAYFYLKKRLHIGLDPSKEGLITRCVDEWFQNQRQWITEREKLNVARFGLSIDDPIKFDRAILYGRVACKELFTEFNQFDAADQLFERMDLGPLFHAPNAPIFLGAASQAVQLAERGFHLDQIAQRTGLDESHVRGAIIANFFPERFQTAVSA